MAPLTGILLFSSASQIEVAANILGADGEDLYFGVRHLGRLFFDDGDPATATDIIHVGAQASRTEQGSDSRKNLAKIIYGLGDRWGPLAARMSHSGIFTNFRSGLFVRASEKTSPPSDAKREEFKKRLEEFFGKIAHAFDELPQYWQVRLRLQVGTHRMDEDGRIDTGVFIFRPKDFLVVIGKILLALLLDASQEKIVASGDPAQGEMLDIVFMEVPKLLKDFPELEAGQETFLKNFSWWGGVKTAQALCNHLTNEARNLNFLPLPSAKILRDYIFHESFFVFLRNRPRNWNITKQNIAGLEPEYVAEAMGEYIHQNIIECIEFIFDTSRPPPSSNGAGVLAIMEGRFFITSVQRAFEKPFGDTANVWWLAPMKGWTTFQSRLHISRQVLERVAFACHQNRGLAASLRGKSFADWNLFFEHIGERLCYLEDEIANVASRQNFSITEVQNLFEEAKAIVNNFEINFPPEIFESAKNKVRSIRRKDPYDVYLRIGQIYAKAKAMSRP